MTNAAHNPGLRSPRPGFTLVELLIVTAIIAALLALMFPVGGVCLAMVRQVSCLNNLRTIGLAMKLYTAEHKGRFPPAWTSGERRWMDSLKPYLDKKSQVYCCPCDAERVPLPWDPQITMSYGMNCYSFKDEAHCFWYGVASGKVERPGQTVLLADCTPGKYYVGGGKSFREPVPGIDYRHMGGSFNALFCDGRVENLKTTTQDDWDASR